MNSKRILLLVLFLFTLRVLSLADLFTFRLPLAVSVTIRVPQDYASIQEALDAASQGSLIIVGEGVYRESLLINKGLTLNGENRNTTIIDGSGLGSGLRIEANDVSISGFTVCNCSYRLPSGEWFPVSGIHVLQSRCTITHNIVANCNTGIYLVGSSDSVIKENIVINNTRSGISIGSQCHDNIIDSNAVVNNGGVGIGIHSTTFSNNIIIGNSVVNHEEGILVVRSDCNIFSRNSIARSGWVGIHLNCANNTTIIENSIRSNGFGEAVYYFLKQFASGIFMEGSHNNTIYHNSFVNNSKQAACLISRNNTWHNDTEGNHWSDYSGSDRNNDNIGDITYVINVYNQDDHPLMKPWAELPWWYIHGILIMISVVTVIGVIVAGLLYWRRCRRREQTASIGVY